MTDVDLSWMNVPGPDGLTWAQKHAAPADLSWMNVPDASGLTFVQKFEQGLLSTPAPTNVPAKGLTPEQQLAWYELTSTLNNYGLGGMSERVKQYLIDNGTQDKTRLRLWIYDQPEFKARFPALESLKNKNRAITPEQYIELEKQYKGAMRAAGLNDNFFDAPNDFTDLIANEVTPDEFRSRIQDGYNRVANTSPLVRQAFQNYFGIQGDQALASFFIDPEKSAPALMRAAAAAEIGAAGFQQDLNIDLNYASRLAEKGVSYQTALEGMQRLSQLSGLFSAGVSETAITSRPSVPANYASLGVQDTGGSTQPIESADKGFIETNIRPDVSSMDTETQQGLDYVFGMDTQTQKELQMRLKQRRAAAGGVSQQNIADRRGRTGIGTAD